MKMNFVKVNTEYFKQGLKPLDALILSVIESFNNNKMLCYCTNEQFAEMFSVTGMTVSNSIDKLEKLGFIARTTHVIRKDGKPIRRRILTIVQTAQE
jgi:DNA-binding MarR family transcriptional regulator